MKLKTSFFLALTCMAVAIPAHATFHGAADAAGMSHIAFHAQMTWQALMSGNLRMFWQLFTEQSVCTSGTDFTFVFTPAFFMTVLIILLATIMMTVIHILQKVQMPWWTKFRHYVH